MFEAYKARSTHGMPYYDRPTNAPGPKPGYDALQNTINQKLAKKTQAPKTAEDAEVSVTGSRLNVQPGDWGDSYQEVKGLIDQLLSYGIDKSILSGVLQYAEEVGYTGESVDNLIKLIQHFNSRGVQDS